MASLQTIFGRIPVLGVRNENGEIRGNSFLIPAISLPFCIQFLTPLGTLATTAWKHCILNWEGTTCLDNTRFKIPAIWSTREKVGQVAGFSAPIRWDYISAATCHWERSGVEILGGVVLLLVYTIGRPSCSCVRCKRECYFYSSTNGWIKTRMVCQILKCWSGTGLDLAIVASWTAAT